MNTAKQAKAMDQDALAELSVRLKKTGKGDMSLNEVMGLAELMTASLQPLLRRIDTTLQRELRGILTRISSLREEISKVQADDIYSNRIPEMGRELSAVVNATENATNDIMEAAETMMNADRADPEKFARVVDTQVMAIFEACSFQDITGQRVTKVVQTVEVIEGRIDVLCQMLEINDISSNSDARTPAEKKRNARLQHGPAHAGEGNNQADIDAMF
ncbi:MAG: protein phosphatase CheZ [Alphaproteobacteria bacterium]|nr:protein phosphatase CheZ [Alphaproteobacteria bacterium]